jgi:A/G-specific adenine glycosylase
VVKKIGAVPGHPSTIAARIIRWQKRHGRHDLPWQRKRDPYAVWVSEIMLQQTQVATVIPYYQRFMVRFPNKTRLARARLDTVLKLWSGLGYYSRARNLHRAAREIAARPGGRFPREFDDIAALPGVGRSTAAAISVFAFGQRHAILDGNVKRVFARLFGIVGWPGDRIVTERLWQIAESLLPRRGIEAYTQGLMDLGATICTRTRPRCAECPVRDDCAALRHEMTDRLPAPRPSRTLPQRQTVMLALLHGGDVLLQRRPASGVWGGLWCLPEVAPGADVRDACRAHFGVDVTPLAALPPIAHVFTHFKLRITVRPCKITAAPSRTLQPGLVWLPLTDAMSAAVPAPVRRILEALAQKAG